jgi:hypothetical protein
MFCVVSKVVSVSSNSSSPTFPRIRGSTRELAAHLQRHLALALLGARLEVLAGEDEVVLLARSFPESLRMVQAAEFIV